jgi:hypothetical protein
MSSCRRIASQKDGKGGRENHERRAFDSDIHEQQARRAEIDGR